MKKKINWSVFVRKLLLVLLFVILFWIIVPVSAIFWSSLSFPRQDVTITPRVYNVEWEDVTLTARDNKKIAAWFLPAERKDRGMILVHGAGTNREHMLQQAVHIVSHYGVSCLLIDMRGHGQSEDSFFTYGITEANDVRVGYSYLKSKLEPDSILGGWGFSSGASALIHSLTEASEVFDFLILESAALYSDLPSLRLLVLKLLTGRRLDNQNTFTVLENYRNPVLAVSGAKESGSFVNNTHWIGKNTIHRHSRSFIVPGAIHGSCWGKQFKEELALFLPLVIGSFSSEH